MKTILCSVASIALALGPLSATTNAAFHFSGRVVDAEGHPVAGATVARYEYAEAYLSRPGADWELKQQVTTPPDGRFDLALPRTQAVFLVTKAGLATAWRQSWNARQDLTNQQLVAISPKALAGVVVDEADKPVSDAQVYVSVAITETALPGGARTFNYLSGKIPAACSTRGPAPMDVFASKVSPMPESLSRCKPLEKHCPILDGSPSAPIPCPGAGTTWQSSSCSSPPGASREK